MHAHLSLDLPGDDTSELIEDFSTVLVTHEVKSAALPVRTCRPRRGMCGRFLLLGRPSACLRSAVSEPPPQLSPEPSLRRLSRNKLGIVGAFEVAVLSFVAPLIGINEQGQLVTQGRSGRQPIGPVGLRRVRVHPSSLAHRWGYRSSPRPRGSAACAWRYSRLAATLDACLSVND
ncbi:hypothetical protein HEB94_002502 [Actinopolymorpha pittospori]|uniref:Uncharacterized protein n=1 Tax=Actinopolymorpha pittospori TaxID=648752 RepID=A0A927MT21_9ACTN|nr:hypothetical protein [Actinopolymorpha pittospori]